MIFIHKNCPNNLKKKRKRTLLTFQRRGLIDHHSHKSKQQGIRNKNNKTQKKKYSSPNLKTVNPLRVDGLQRALKPLPSSLKPLTIKLRPASLCLCFTICLFLFFLSSSLFFVLSFFHNDQRPECEKSYFFRTLPSSPPSSKQKQFPHSFHFN